MKTIFLAGALVCMSSFMATACDDASGAPAVSIPAVDSIQRSVKAFRRDKSELIRNLRAEINVELAREKPNAKVIDKLQVQQSEARLAVARAWAHALIQAKKIVSAEQFQALVRANWGCKCGDNDCGCTEAHSDGAAPAAETPTK